MTRTIIGGLLGGVLLYLVGFLFWGTPLSGLAYSSVDVAQNAAVQTSLAQNLTEAGTGTYLVPSPGTQEGTIAYGRGPIATVHFNVQGYPVVDSSALITGFVLALATGLLIAFALASVRVSEFADRARLALLFALAITLYLDLGQPIFNHYGWGYFIYLFLGDFLGLAAAGLLIARFFAPKAVVSPPRENPIN